MPRTVTSLARGEWSRWSVERAGGALRNGGRQGSRPQPRRWCARTLNTYDLIRALREAGCARALCCPRMYVFVTRGTSILRARNTKPLRHCVGGEKKKKVVCSDRKGALVGPSGGWRHAAAVFENYSQTDSVLQQPARRPAGSRAGAACRDRPVTTECQPG